MGPLNLFALNVIPAIGAVSCSRMLLNIRSITQMRGETATLPCQSPDGKQDYGAPDTSAMTSFDEKTLSFGLSSSLGTAPTSTCTTTSSQTAFRSR